jgi:hypothetical protein
MIDGLMHLNGLIHLEIVHEDEDGDEDQQSSNTNSNADDTAII